VTGLRNDGTFGPTQFFKILFRSFMHPRRNPPKQQPERTVRMMMYWTMGSSAGAAVAAQMPITRNALNMIARHRLNQLRTRQCRRRGVRRHRSLFQWRFLPVLFRPAWREMHPSVSTVAHCLTYLTRTTLLVKAVGPSTAIRVGGTSLSVTLCGGNSLLARTETQMPSIA
jgi:hypothetical protein